MHSSLIHTSTRGFCQHLSDALSPSLDLRNLDSTASVRSLLPTYTSTPAPRQRTSLRTSYPRSLEPTSRGLHMTRIAVGMARKSKSRRISAFPTETNSSTSRLPSSLGRPLPTISRGFSLDNMDLSTASGTRRFRDLFSTNLDSLWGWKIVCGVSSAFSVLWELMMNLLSSKCVGHPYLLCL
jgi:hypothetical protein